MNPKSIHKETNGLYTPIREAGKADEITALERIRSLFSAEKNNTVAKHLPILINNDPVKDGGSGWLAVSPVCGFDLERLRVVVTSAVQPSSEKDTSRRFTFPAIPEVLILHIAKQLTQAIGWLHNVANISHNDVFGGNVMLDISASTQAPDFTFIFPTVVLIDFDRATLNPDNMAKGADRSYTYELVYMLDNAGRASLQETNTMEDAIITTKESMTWWDAFRNFLIVNKGQYLQDEAAGFAKFWGRFGEDVDWRLGNVTGEERRRVKELVEGVMAGEVRFPGDEEIREVLGR
ncbi:hypothetical protein J4E93_009713 [Alternaria ventricosa]|uniref:uncharacterized protein n=1 Tax=Alternaria ventricosa TaxID=1187951 RepID=UPI0020C36E14|nr:uncharacterized protein J4E93_009713 [Alternaria ventricosa]KAI4638685.1 hypothetical protein J4E93_009713 [Alternaria ventricosa]